MRPTAVVLALALGLAGPDAAAQTRPPRPASLDLTAGWARFSDEGPVDHSLLGASVRLPVLERLSVGPEVVWMFGPLSDQDLLLTGNLTFDWLRPGPGPPPLLAPFVVVGGGLFRHSDRFGGRRFSSTEGGFTAGGGLRGRVNRRISAGAELRFGWEPHVRLTGFASLSLGR